MNFKIGTLVYHSFHYYDNENYYFTFNIGKNGSEFCCPIGTYHSSVGTFKFLTDIFV